MVWANEADESRERIKPKRKASPRKTFLYQIENVHKKAGMRRIRGLV